MKNLLGTPQSLSLADSDRSWNLIDFKLIDKVDGKEVPRFHHVTELIQIAPSLLFFFFFKAQCFTQKPGLRFSRLVYKFIEFTVNRYICLQQLVTSFLNRPWLIFFNVNIRKRERKRETEWERERQRERERETETETERIRRAIPERAQREGLTQR